MCATDGPWGRYIRQTKQDAESYIAWLYLYVETNKQKKQAETENRSEKFRGLRWVSAGKDNTWVKRVKRHKPPGLSHGNETYSILTVVNDVCWVCESCQEDRSLNFSWQENIACDYVWWMLTRPRKWNVKKTNTSLVVRWLRAPLQYREDRFNARSETKTPHATGQLSTHAATKTQHSQNSKDKTQFQLLKKSLRTTEVRHPMQGHTVWGGKPGASQPTESQHLSLTCFVLRPGGNPGT